jgi:vitamin B12 transporter
LADLTVIDRAEIERYGAGSISELLSRLPGIQSLDVGTESIFIRGANANQTAIYVDGVRFESQDKGGGSPRLDLLNLAHVQRIEVLRGPASGLYGANAMGGVIQIFTDGAAVGKWVSIGMGSEGLKRGGLGLSGAVGEQWSYRLGLDRSVSDGYATEIVRTSTADTMPWRSGSLNVGLDLKVDADNTVSYVLNATEKDRESNPNPWGAQPTTNERTQRNSVMSGLNWKSQWNDLTSSQVTLSTTRIGVHGTSPENFETRLWDLNVGIQHKLEAGTLSANVERKLDRLQADAHPGNAAISTARGQKAIGLGWTAKFGRFAWQANARNDDDENFGKKTTGGIVSSVDLDNKWRVAAGISTGFRAPTVEQSGGGYGSTNVKPESSNSKELRLHYSEASTRAELVLYRTQYSSMLTSGGTDCLSGIFCWRNLNVAKVEGLTLSGQTMLGIVTLSGSVDALRARDGITNLPLNYRPNESATLNVSVPISGWTLGTQIQAVGQRFHNSGATVLPGYALLNVHARKALSSNLTLLTRINNATSRIYSGDGFNATPSRRWFVGLNWQGK